MTRPRQDLRDQRPWYRGGPDARRPDIDSADSWRSGSKEEAEAAIDAIAGKTVGGAATLRRSVQPGRQDGDTYSGAETERQWTDRPWTERQAADRPIPEHGSVEWQQAP